MVSFTAFSLSLVAADSLLSGVNSAANTKLSSRDLSLREGVTVTPETLRSYLSMMDGSEASRTTFGAMAPKPAALPRHLTFVQIADQKQEEAKRRVATAIGYFHNAPERDPRGIRRCYLVPTCPILAPGNPLIDERVNGDFDSVPIWDLLSPVIVICAMIPPGGRSLHPSSPPSGPFRYVKALGNSEPRDARMPLRIVEFFSGADTQWELHLYSEGRFLSEAELLQWE